MRAARNKRVMVLSFGRFVGWKYTTQKLEELYSLQCTFEAQKSQASQTDLAVPLSPTRQHSVLTDNKRHS